MQVLNNYILIKPDTKEEQTASGIIIPGEKDQTTETGTVVASQNPDLQDKKVMFKDYNLMNVELDGEKHYFLQEDELLAIID